MDERGPYADAGAASAGIERSMVMGRALICGLAIGAAAGAISGTASFGILGTLFGVVLGAFATVIPSAIGAALMGWAATTDDVEVYRRRVDVVLAAFGVAMTLLAVLWLAQRALSGPAAPITALISVIVGLVLSRRWLHRVGASAEGGAF